MAKHNNSLIQQHVTEAPTPRYNNYDDESRGDSHEPGKTNPDERREE
jgi:hypothetical protein